MAKGLKQAKSCVVFIGEESPQRWFAKEIEVALIREIKEPSFRIIPVLPPNTSKSNIPDFLESKTFVDYSNGLGNEESFYRLLCGIKGVQPYRFSRNREIDDKRVDKARQKLIILKKLKEDNLVNYTIILEHQNFIVKELLSDRESNG